MTKITARLACFSMLLSATGCAATLALDAKLQCMAEPESSTPIKTSGEFPFRLVYRKNGVEKLITDTQICKLRDPGCRASERPASWHEGLKSGRTVIPIESFAAGDEIEQFNVSPYPCSALMETSTFRHKDDKPLYAVDAVRYRDGKKVGTSGAASATWKLAKHGVEIISYEQWSAGDTNEP
ncbi:hypothetical protein M2650_16075 [Luteimonas sp. SX5]|uniref:Lipoprotein n=1 Tax=Luteimonas galliterrae TaxID=2940486 RepID=A0ABT0MMM2_9GAMM|nr:hypothetical protein [Luteimonas galliterrae]MCL1636140.1 hypothetical protein [Luteimonas galliterrae]